MSFFENYMDGLKTIPQISKPDSVGYLQEQVQAGKQLLEKMGHAPTPETEKLDHVPIFNIPPAPPPELSKAQLKQLEPFSGVYFAYVGNELVYVGESENVPNRATTSRPEINEVTGFGVIRCHSHMRFILEAACVGAYCPPRNAVSPVSQLDGRTPEQSHPTAYRAEMKFVRPEKSDDEFCVAAIACDEPHLGKKSKLFRIDQDGGLLLPSFSTLTRETLIEPTEKIVAGNLTIYQKPVGAYCNQDKVFWRKPSFDLHEFHSDGIKAWVDRLREAARLIHSGEITPTPEQLSPGESTWTADQYGLPSNGTRG